MKQVVLAVLLVLSSLVAALTASIFGARFLPLKKGDSRDQR